MHSRVLTTVIFFLVVAVQVLKQLSSQQCTKPLRQPLKVSPARAAFDREFLLLKPRTMFGIYTHQT